MTLQTDRLVLRPWREEDAEPAFRIYGDPEVSRFLGDGKPTPSLEVQRERLAGRIKHYEAVTDGSVFWAMEHKDVQTVIGSILVKRLPDNDGVATDDWEVGWHLGQFAWGQGFASEGGRAGIRYALEELKLPVIYAVVRPENSASLRVTERIEMRPLGVVSRYYGADLQLFERRSPL